MTQIKLSPMTPGRTTIEVEATNIQVVGLVEDAEFYPIAKKDTLLNTSEHSLTYSRAPWRKHKGVNNVIGAVSRIRNCLANTIHNYFYQRGFQ